MTVLHTKEDLTRIRKFVMWQCVKTDVLFGGRMKLARNYRLSEVKREFGLKGNKERVFKDLTALLLKDGTLNPCINHPDRPAHRQTANLCDECWPKRGPKLVAP